MDTVREVAGILAAFTLIGVWVALRRWYFTLPALWWVFK